jgi:hypothetical protein
MSLQKVVIPLQTGINPFVNSLERMDSPCRMKGNQALSKVFAVSSANGKKRP